MVVHDKVKEIIANQLAVNIKDITDNTTFSDINADSLDVVDIIMALESEFNLQIPDEEVQICLTDKLDKFIGNINSLSNALESGIKELMNLKQSLISEVVTGKIDVRNVVIPEYEKVTALDDEVEELDEMEGIEDGN